MAIFRGPGGAGNATTDSEITLLTQLEQSASASAANASTSATNAANSATSAATSATNAATSASQAATSASNAAGSATAAASSATSASNSASAASTSETNAANSASAASTLATNAANSASAAAASATNAAASATAALASETAAGISETNAAASASTATTQAGIATTQASNAAASASAALTSETNAANSASAAATSASNAATSETNAATSESNAASSASAAALSESNAASSETNAATSASNAATSETNAANSASAASTSASNAATSETNAANSASAALTSENNAATSESNAATSAANAEAAYDDFDDRYLGAKATAPTVDNDGDPLIVGALYFDTTLNEMRVYDGSLWKSAGSTVNGTAVRQTFTATAAQTTFTITGGYDAGFADVYLNGVKLVNGVDVDVTSGTDVVLTVGAAAGDSVDVIAYGAFVLADHYTKAEADAEFLPQVNPSYTGTLTGGTGVINIGSGQLYKDASGNVGIGTSSPTVLSSSGKTLDIVGDLVGGLRLERTNVTNPVTAVVLATNGEFRTGAQSNSVYTFRTDNTERMRITSGGRVGIGVTAPGYRLELPNIASVEGQGRANAWPTYSDGRIKTEREELPYGLDAVMQLEPLKYFQHNSTTNEDGELEILEEGIESIGLVAQDVASVIPEIVSVPEDLNKDLCSMDYAKLTTVLVKAIQEQQAMITSQAEIISAQQAALEQLKADVAELKGAQA
jgi:hypothetical protein